MGDCDASGAVAVDELVRAVRVHLGTSPPGLCEAADHDGNGTITDAEVTAAIGQALNGCHEP